MLLAPVDRGSEKGLFPAGTMGSIYIQEEEEDMANELIWSFPSGVPCLLVEVDVETDIGTYGKEFQLKSVDDC